MAQNDMIKLPELKRITQEYFDTIVNENINDFDMSPEEAVQDAVNQCKSQGCDVSTICKFSPAEQEELISALRKLDQLLPDILTHKTATSEKEAEVLTAANETLLTIKKKFDQDISYRVLGTRIEAPNAYAILMKFFETLEAPSASEDQTSGNKSNVLTENFINTFQSYIHHQSDVLDTEGTTKMILTYPTLVLFISTI